MGLEHLIDLGDFSTARLQEILSLASDIKRAPKQYYGSCSGKILATLFYEPSTRTQMSFQTAMLRLGGSVIGFDNPMNSSVSKGESLKDTVKIVSGYADLIVIRNPIEGSARAAAQFSSVPVINAGDGGHLHPTQTLTDLTTLSAEKGSLKHLVIGICGDLKNGRTVHSLVKTMSRFDAKFIFISTPELAIPTYIKDILNQAGCSYLETSSLEEVIGELDVLYMTRIQRERFTSIEEYDRLKGVYTLTKKKLELARKDMIVLHPLPRVDEISVDVDPDPRARYFDQAIYGMYARMALILKVLEGNKDAKELAVHTLHQELQCKNPKCVTNYEPYLERTFLETGNLLVCDYCEERLLP